MVAAEDWSCVPAQRMFEMHLLPTACLGGLMYILHASVSSSVLFKGPMELDFQQQSQTERTAAWHSSAICHSLVSLPFADAIRCWCCLDQVTATGIRNLVMGSSSSSTGGWDVQEAGRAGSVVPGAQVSPPVHGNHTVFA